MRFPREHFRLAQAAQLLHDIRRAPNQLSTVLELQRSLIRNISRGERRIRRLKRARHRLSALKSRGRLTKEKAKLVKLLVNRIDAMVVEVRHLLFLWRCFGDGIAFTYQSKYSLKHLLYDGDYNVKQDAGFISDKTGFRQEYRHCRLGIRMGVPVVLSDLTNIIRHGDICALGAEDPVPIEMKSSKNRNARSDRQVEQLQVLADFFANDGAVNFRGTGNTKRVEIINPEINYEREINDCMTRVTACGFASSSPEPGLRYIIFSTEWFTENPGLLDAELRAYASYSTLCVSLTPDMSWLPAYPFTLSMDEHNSILFMQEIVHIVALIDLLVLKKHFNAQGLHATMLMNGADAVQICIDPTDLMKGAMRLSEQLLLRTVCEFQSIKWFADEHSLFFEPKNWTLSIAPDTPGLISEPLPGWQDVIDCFEGLE
ncbi:hypothetical protein LOY35_18905 [Pseudomonas sp. B21-028]|uniref:hypothetical protein n=1 Tax=Pseudomonas sp. B21-028 TaxID=2895480 RepID=UPI0021609407|nr:hypothetical protein [Pseudomonas sp. B21-028]UVL82287.1 hypothetical protein LOY35_18905 [Pseudomonas sp. B21-028]